MRETKRGTGFFLNFIMNVVFNIGWSIPAWILLVMHFWLDWSILWFWIAFGLWIAIVVFWMCMISWSAKCGNEKDPPKKNINPYSVGAKKDTDLSDR